MTLSRFSSLSVIFYMPYRPLRAYGGMKIYLKICLKKKGHFSGICLAA